MVSALGSQDRRILPARLIAATLPHPQDLGYPLELGYQNFLYPSEPDLRDLLLFLAERLPTDASEDADQPAGVGCLGRGGGEGEGVVGAERGGSGEKVDWWGGVCVFRRARWEDWGWERGCRAGGRELGLGLTQVGSWCWKGPLCLTSCLAPASLTPL